MDAREFERKMLPLSMDICLDLYHKYAETLSDPAGAAEYASGGQFRTTVLMNFLEAVRIDETITYRQAQDQHEARPYTYADLVRLIARCRVRPAYSDEHKIGDRVDVLEDAFKRMVPQMASTPECVELLEEFTSDGGVVSACHGVDEGAAEKRRKVNLPELGLLFVQNLPALLEKRYGKKNALQEAIKLLARAGKGEKTKSGFFSPTRLWRLVEDEDWVRHLFDGKDAFMNKWETCEELGGVRFCQQVTRGVLGILQDGDSSGIVDEVKRQFEELQDGHRSEINWDHIRGSWNPDKY